MFVAHTHTQSLLLLFISLTKVTHLSTYEYQAMYITIIDIVQSNRYAHNKYPESHFQY